MTRVAQCCRCPWTGAGSCRGGCRCGWRAATLSAVRSMGSPSCWPAGSKSLRKVAGVEHALVSRPGCRSAGGAGRAGCRGEASVQALRCVEGVRVRPHDGAARPHRDRARPRLAIRVEGARAPQRRPHAAPRARARRRAGPVGVGRLRDRGEWPPRPAGSALPRPRSRDLRPARQRPLRVAALQGARALEPSGCRRRSGCLRPAARAAPGLLHEPGHSGRHRRAPRAARCRAGGSVRNLLRNKGRARLLAALPRAGGPPGARLGGRGGWPEFVLPGHVRGRAACAASTLQPALPLDERRRS